jgi:hypothetical protein
METHPGLERGRAMQGSVGQYARAPVTAAIGKVVGKKGASCAKGFQINRQNSFPKKRSLIWEVCELSGRD